MTAVVQMHRRLRTITLVRNCAIEQAGAGATSIEYGLIAMVISISILGMMNTIGSEVTELFVAVVDAFPK
jgi:Flp pilus assembly pilin Flp